MHKSCSRGYDSYAQGSLLFRLKIVLQLLNSCRSLIPFSKDLGLQKTLSSGLGSPSHIGSFSFQYIAKQSGLISSPT